MSDQPTGYEMQLYDAKGRVIVNVRLTSRESAGEMFLRNGAPTTVKVAGYRLRPIYPVKRRAT